MKIKIIINDDIEVKCNMNIPTFTKEDFDIPKDSPITFEALKQVNGSSAIARELNQVLSQQIGLDIMRYIIEEDIKE